MLEIDFYFLIKCQINEQEAKETLTKYSDSVSLAIITSLMQLSSVEMTFIMKRRMIVTRLCSAIVSSNSITPETYSHHQSEVNSINFNDSFHNASLRSIINESKNT